MPIDTTQPRSFVGSVWQEISSLWSGVEFPFYDQLQDASQQPERELAPFIAMGDANYRGNAGGLESCC
jgi:hypothetical protein